MNKKLRGSSVLLLLMIVSFITISITLLYMINRRDQAMLINKVDMLQARYITSGYRDLYIDEIQEDKTDQVDKPENIFTDLDYEIDIKNDVIKLDIDKKYLPVDILEVEVTGNYNDYNYKSYAHLIVYNKLLYSKSGRVEEGRYEGIDHLSFCDLKDRIRNYIDNNDLRDLSGYTLSNRSSVEDEIEDVGEHLNLLDIKSLEKFSDYIIYDSVQVGEEDSRTLFFDGTIYNKGVITLNTNLEIDGIFVSDGGVLIDNGYNLIINGIFIDISGSNISDNYSGIVVNHSIIDYKHKIKDLEWAKDYRLLYRNNDPDL